MRLLGSCLFLVLYLATGANVGADKNVENRNITKCKDENGVWHYGDFARDNCADDSKVTELNQSGIQVRVEQAQRDIRESKTLSEVSQRKQEQQLAEREARSRDLRLLNTYENIDQLIKTRDERINYIVETLRIDQQFLGQLHNQLSSLNERYQQHPNEKLALEIAETEKYIERYEQVIASRSREHQDAQLRFDTEIARYRQLVQTRDAAERAQAGY